LSDDERAELKSLTMRRKMGQAPALRARIVLTCAEGGQNKEVAASWALTEDVFGKIDRKAGKSDRPVPPRATQISGFAS